MMGIFARRVDKPSWRASRQQLVFPAIKRRYRETAPNVIVPIDQLPLHPARGSKRRRF
jgi:hypothetical protein